MTSWQILWISAGALSFYAGFKRVRNGARLEIFGWIPLSIGCLSAAFATEPKLHILVGISALLIAGGSLFLARLFMKHIPVS